MVRNDHLILPEQPRLSQGQNDAGVRFRMVHETKHSRHVCCNACNAAESDLVSMNRVADLAIRQAATHQPFYRRSRFCGKSYRSGKREDESWVF